MNRAEHMFDFKGEAQIRYLDGEFQVLAHGDFVKCAVSGKPIPLSELRYWSVDRQEAYYSAKEALQCTLACRQSDD